ncbi:hypothetical protein M153_5320002, partial [Pseudoloma neurophilia]
HVDQVNQKSYKIRMEQIRENIFIQFYKNVLIILKKHLLLKNIHLLKTYIY